jgi:hypothetical protein
MRPARALRWAVLVVAPLLIAASDPRGDVEGCRGGPGGVAPDLVDVRGEIVELGTSARWTLTFAAPLEIPDAAGRPFRVDIAIHDPDVPAVSFAYYRDVNRLVRVDATTDHTTEIYLLPERATNEFIAPVIRGDTMTIQVPGRILSDDEDLTGTEPGLDRLRWTAIVRDGAACDFLDRGGPTERLVATPSATATPQGSPSPEGVTPDGRGPSPWWFAAAAGVGVVLAAGAYASRRRASP